MKNLRAQATSAYFQEFKALSDIDYGYNKETGKFDVPAVEWDTVYGRFWSYYESEKAREMALDFYQKNLDEFVTNWIKAFHAEKKAKKDAFRKSRNTMGNLFPELLKLKDALK